MTSRGKAKPTTRSSERDKEAEDVASSEEPAACGAVHSLPLLSHVTCQRPAGHTDDQPQGPDQDKHRARQAGALYVW